MTMEEAINTLIKSDGVDTNKISDGYHTFGELYEHRITLFIKLCDILKFDEWDIWRSKNHSDGNPAFGGGWFVLGIGTKPGEQITYHLPISKWDDCSFAETLDKAPEWDEHTSDDVLKRLKAI